jgi:nitroimidazol reductase NimA-like FMN-containing flavoprotein (pyridoxamine 5'-phosphate oxidase superfamily)
VAVPSIARVEELSAEECLRLLGTQQVGRLGVVVGGQPLVLPVNYVLDDDTIVFRSDPGTKLDAASLQRVAFEVDQLQPRARVGWSVLVQGVGQEVRAADGAAYQRVQALPVVPWTGGAKAHFVRVVPAG